MQTLNMSWGMSEPVKVKKKKSKVCFLRYIGGEVSRNVSQKKSISTSSVFERVEWRWREFMVVFREFVNQEQMIVDFAMDMYQKQMALLQQSPCIERSLKKCVLICLICCLSCVFFTRRHGFEHLLWPCMCTITDYLLCKRSIICHQSPSISKYGT